MNPDDLNDDKLRDILAAHPAPEPEEAVKQEHIARAVAAFEQKMQKSAKSTQGNENSQRLTDTINQFGSFIMSLISGKNRASLAFASIAVAAIGISVGMHLMSSTSQQAILAETQQSDQVAALPEQEKKEAETPTVPMPMENTPKAKPVIKEDLSAILSVRRQAENKAAESRMATADVAVAPPASMEMVGAGVAVGSAPGMMMPDYYPQPMYQGADKFSHAQDNPVKSVSAEPVSTFSIDVDTASYSFIRRQITQGVLPTPDAVRIEEMINYFPYSYPVPESKSEPFKPTVAVYPTPWNKETKLLHIGIKGYDVARDEAPKSNLVFLVDTSGSMAGADRLPLLISSLKMLLETLDEDDTVGIVTYAGSSGVALEPTKVKDKTKILNVMNGLMSGGSTAGAAGIETAYQLAAEHFDKHAVNRVILATDGDFNVGISDPEQLKSYIEKKRESGIFLSVLGFGEGNYNDALMQALAQNGNGIAAYIDTLNEGRKVLVEEATSALFPIAKDVKIQVEFNPAQVAEYRLIGYETRHLNREDFNNDKVDAGELGAGHTVTAIYEITPTDSKARLIDDLRYGKEEKPVAKEKDSGEIAFLKLRYKLPDGEKSTLMTRPITAKYETSDIAKESDDIRFAASVAAFGQKLKGSNYVADYGYDRIIKLADGARGKDSFGYRAEFVNLVRLAKSSGVSNQVSPGTPVEPQPMPVPMYQTR